MQNKTISSPISVSNTKQSRKIFRLNSLAASVTLALTLVVVPFSLSAQGNSSKWVEGQILVKPIPGLSNSKLELILSRSGAKSVGKIQQIGVHIVNVPPQAEEKVVAALSHNPNIEFAELNMLVPVNETFPSDPSYGSQWHLSKINGPIAWDTSMGDGITVAIIDTGVHSNHPDLIDHMLPGFNSVDNSTNTSDVMGHGTAVAGTVGATANNGTGIASVAWHVNLLPVRVSNVSDGVAQWSDLAEGLTWAADNGANVANISYSISASSTITTAALYMKNKGGVVVSSAGNSGADLGYGDNAHIITVSATDSSDAITSWSSFGNFVDIAAPGQGIYTTHGTGSCANWNGTSFSSPVVAGVAALVLSANPNLLPDDVENILESTALDLGTTGWDNKFGHGRIDAGAAVLAALDAQPVIDTTAPVISTNLIDGQTITGSITISVNASDDVGVSRVDLLIDGSKIATDSNAPFQFVWDSSSVSDGGHSIEARALDAAGNMSVDSAMVTVSNPVIEDIEAPSVGITSHTDGETVSGNVKIQLSASDNIGVSLLACYVDGSVISISNDVSSLTCSWNTRKESSGSHIIEARAQDAAGNQATHNINLIVGGSTSTGGSGKGRK